MQYKRFEDLPVWQKAKDLAVQIYKVTQHGKLAKCYSLVEQIRKSAVSVSSNIAEGFERGFKKRIHPIPVYSQSFSGRAKMPIAHRI